MRSWTPVEVAHLMCRKAEGVCEKLIARELDRTPLSIHGKCDRLGLTRTLPRPPSRSRYILTLKRQCDVLGVPLYEALDRTRWRPVTRARFLTWRALHSQGYGVAAIGRVAGYHWSTVIAGLRRVGG